MKKIILIITLFLSFNVWAQNGRNDNFFNNWDDVSNGIDKIVDEELPPMPGGHGGGGDIPAPLGSGLFILTALGAGYAIKRKGE